MESSLLPDDYVIGSENFKKVLTVDIDGKRMSRGLVPRDYNKFPIGSYEMERAYDPSELPLIPREEWPERISEGMAKQMFLSHIRDRGDNGNPIPALNQNGQGYCWFYSGTGGIQLLRAKANQEYVALSAHSGAWTIKGGRDQGGWGAAGLEFQMERGVIPQSLWPQGSMNGRRYGTPANWEVAKRYRCIESWMDITGRAYDKDMTFDQVMTCLLLNIPVIGDFNWWGHSVILMDPVKVTDSRDLYDANTWGVRNLNSWGNNWGNNGTSVLKGRKAVPDGGAALISVWGN